MEAWYTAKPYKTSGRRPSTASPSPGLPYEEFAERLAARLGYELVARNFRVHHLEGDLLLKAEDGTLYLWEVRGRRVPFFKPSQMIAPRKLANLRRLAASVQQRSRGRVRLQLVELIGVPPRVTWKIFDIET